MSAPRIGSLGVANTKGDLYVIDTAGNIERLPVGNDGQVLQADSAVALGVKWVDSSIVSRATLAVDLATAIFQQINIGGLIANPSAALRGSNAVLGYNDTIIQGIPWQLAMPQIYDGGNLTLKIYWAALAAIAGDVIWAAAMERDNAGSSLTADHFAALQTAAASTAPGVLGNIAVASIPFTNAQADAIAAGDPFRLFVQRTASALGDTMVGDAQIVRVTLIED